MSVTIDPPARIDETSILVTFSSDLGGTPTFYIFQYGLPIGETTQGEWLFFVPPGESLVIHIFDAAGDVPDDVFPGRFTLGWDSVEGAATYSVEEEVSSVWTVRQTVQSTGRGWYTWLTRYLEDVTVHLFRVVPVASSGERGNAIQFSGLIVRNPEPPTHSLVYAGGDLTIDE